MKTECFEICYCPWVHKIFNSVRTTFLENWKRGKTNGHGLKVPAWFNLLLKVQSPMIPEKNKSTHMVWITIRRIMSKEYVYNNSSENYSKAIPRQVLLCHVVGCNVANICHDCPYNLIFLILLHLAAIGSTRTNVREIIMCLTRFNVWHHGSVVDLF